MSNQITEALHHLERERGIPRQTLLRNIEDAITVAYRKVPDAVEFFQVRYLEEEGDFKIFQQLIPEDLEDEILWHDPSSKELKVDFDALKFYREQVPEQDVTPKNFGRVAAIAAKGVISQRLRDYTQDQVYEAYRGREGEMVIGEVQQGDKRHTLVNLGNGVEALLPVAEQVRGEKYRHGAKIRATIVHVERRPKGCSIVLSRTHPELVRQLLIQEVPEASNGLIEITRVVRDPGFKAKVGVISTQEGIDPVGACIGPRGSRIRNVINELSGEKIDIIPLDAEPSKYLAKSLAPAKVLQVEVDEEQQHATLVVSDEDISSAIGKRGQNVKLTAQLTGWKLDILSQEQYAHVQEYPEQEENSVDLSGRCSAVLSNGRRCPNMAVEDSHYCGLPRHSVLSFFDTHSVKPLQDLSNEEIKVILDQTEGAQQLSVKVEQAINALAQEVETTTAEAENSVVEETQEVESSTDEEVV